MENQSGRNGKPAARKRSPFALLLLLFVLLVAAVAASVVSNGNVTRYDAHDHNRDGTPDHGAGAH